MTTSRSAAVQHVVALPPFVLGVKQDRYLEHAGAIEPDIIALDGEGKPVAGLAMTVRLVHRNWNSVLQASDFAQGSAKYETEVIDETVEERHVTSTGDAPASAFRRAPRPASIWSSCRRPTGSAGRRPCQGRPVHGRRHAGDLVAAAGADGDGDAPTRTPTIPARPPRW